MSSHAPAGCRQSDVSAVPSSPELDPSSDPLTASMIETSAMNPTIAIAMMTPVLDRGGLDWALAAG